MKEGYFRNQLKATFHPAYGGEGAVVHVFVGEQSSILNEHPHRLQDESDEELNVDVIPGTAKPPVKTRNTKKIKGKLGRGLIKN